MQPGAGESTAISQRPCSFSQPFSSYCRHSGSCRCIPVCFSLWSSVPAASRCVPRFRSASTERELNPVFKAQHETLFNWAVLYRSLTSNFLRIHFRCKLGVVAHCTDGGGNKCKEHN